MKAEARYVRDPYKTLVFECSFCKYDFECTFSKLYDKRLLSLAKKIKLNVRFSYNRLSIQILHHFERHFDEFDRENLYYFLVFACITIKLCNTKCITTYANLSNSGTTLSLNIVQLNIQKSYNFKFFVVSVVLASIVIILALVTVE